MKKYMIYIACLLAILWGCNPNNKSNVEYEEHNHETHAEHDHEHKDEDGHDHEHDHKAENEDTHGDEISLSPEKAKTVGLEVIEAKPSSFNQVIKTSGQLTSAQGDEITVSAPSSGIVSFNKSSLNEGAVVKVGESLINISSKGIIDGDPAIRAKSIYEIANREYQRAESLIKDKLISEKEYNEIKLNYENARIAYQAVGQKTTAKGISVATPLSGFVKTKYVNEGQYVEIGQPLMTITQNRKLQLRADISERYYKNLGNINSANFKTPYDNTLYKLSDLNGRFVSYGKAASNQEYYIPVNFEFDNIGQIVSGGYVEVYLLGKPRENVIVLPISSLIEEQGVFSVYLQVHDDAFKKQEVKLGESDGEKVEIISGIKAGDKVVSKGAYQVKLASTSSAIPHGHEH